MSAETYRDAWGIPHLRADSPVELARAQGRVTALDRGWQLEVERHRAEGTSAAFLGPEALSWDRLARRARLADTARRCFSALEEKDAETAAWVRAYVDGVNEGLVRHPDGSGSPNGFGSPGGSGTWDGSGHRDGSGTRDGSGHRGGSGTWDGSGHRGGSGTWDGSGHRGGSGTRDGSGHRGGSGTRDGSGHRGGSGTWDGSGHRDGSGGREGPGGRDGSGHRGDHPRPRDASRRRDGLGRRSDLRTPSVPPAPEFARAALAPGRWEPWTPLAVWLATHILFAGFPAKLWREHITTRLGPDAAALFAADGPGTTGSNGWLLSGGRTTTGHALIAGDPHRWIEDPGVYQQIHLSCPEFDVVGLAVPGVPGIAHFGHTGTVAWAITNAMSDYQDLYRERLRRTGAGVEALGPDGTWRRAARHTETIRVAGEGTEERTGETAEVEVIETDRGPVIAGGPEGLDDGTPDALSLRYPPRVTSDLGFGALLPLLRARTVADVDRALDAWAEPVNVVQAADTEGGLLHRVAGRVPVRAAVNGLRPVPAWEPGHEWTGWHTPPRADVDDGVAVMANQRGLATPLGVEFAAPHRADRIAALLAAERRWSAADLPAIHTDTHLGSAGPLLDHLAALTGLSPEAAALRDRVLAWDRRMDAHSVGAAAYAAVRGALVRRLAAHPVLAPASVAPAYPEVLQPWLALVPRVAYALEHLLRADDLYGIDRAAAVGAALEEAAACPPAGPWGDTHRLASWRALPDPAARTDEPGLFGDHDCVLCTSSVPGLTDRAARGPAARYVWDLADRGNSRWVVPHGACGTPGSPHHRDQQPLWLAGELAPVITDFDRLTLTEETDV